MTSDGKKLKPCPFCGGEAEILTAKSMYGGDLHGVICGECGSRGDVYDTEAEAIADWNTRTATTIGKVQVEIEPMEQTCRNINVNGYGFIFGCSACGYSVIAHNCTIRLDELPNYCPNCGAKVVSE